MEQLCCPCDFTALSVEKQKEMFDIAKELANYKLVEESFTHSFWDSDNSKIISLKPGEIYKRTKAYIHRPIRISDLPKGWEFYTKYLNDAYPSGERLAFKDECTLGNYKLLYSWIRGGCTNCHSSKDNIHWDEGDKHIEYHCFNCGDETPFVKHWRSYY